MHKIVENSNLYIRFHEYFQGIRRLRTPFDSAGLLIAINSRPELVPAFVTDRVARSSEISSRIIRDRAKYRSVISIQAIPCRVHTMCPASKSRPRRFLITGTKISHAPPRSR